MQKFTKQEVAKILQDIDTTKSNTGYVRETIKNKFGIDVDDAIIEKSSEQDLYMRILGILYGTRRINTVGAIIINPIMIKQK